MRNSLICFGREYHFVSLINSLNMKPILDDPIIRIGIQAILFGIHNNLNI